MPDLTPLPLSADEVAALVHRAVAGGAGAWSLGVQGAVAEVVLSGAAVSVPGRERSVMAVTPHGGLRIDLPDDTEALDTGRGDLLLTVPVAALGPVPCGVTVERGDPGALDPADRGGWLVDLGLGRPACRFCVRTADPALAAALEAVEGLGWDEALDRVGHRLVAESPHRVVITGAGRAEVYSPIPPAGAVSPAGSHTHLLPERLRRGEDLPPGVVLAAGRVLGAVWHGGGSAGPHGPAAPGPNRRSPASPRPGRM